MILIFLSSKWVRHSVAKWVCANLQKTKQTEANNFYSRLLFTDIKFPSQLGKLWVVCLIEFTKFLLLDMYRKGKNIVCNCKVTTFGKI